MKVDLAKNQHQDNLKIEIYHQFKQKFINPPFSLLAEYKIDNCRFDLLLYDKKTLEILCLIEVRRINTKKEVSLYSKKHIKYSMKCPFIVYISRYDEIENFLDNISQTFL